MLHLAPSSVREVEKRILNNFIDLLILISLNSYRGQIGGYDVIKYLQLKYHFLPSAGTVYSCLYHMEKRGLLRGKQNGKKRVYTLTKHGAETAKAIINLVEKLGGEVVGALFLVELSALEGRKNLNIPVYSLIVY